MSSEIERRAATTIAQGYGTQNSEQVACDTTAGGTAIPATALTARAWILVQMDPAGSGTLYLGFGTVTASANFAKLTAGQSVFLPLGAGLALKGLASTGTINVQILELAL